MASLMPPGKQQYFTASGAPLAGGKLYTYAAGTSSPLSTYSDKAGVTPNTNPVILDARGEASIFWGPAGYKAVLKDMNDVLIWTQDNLYAVQDSSSMTFAQQLITAVEGQTVFNLSVSYVNGSNAIAVYCNGLRLPSTDYVETSTTTVTMLNPATLGDEFLFVVGTLTATTSSADLVSYAPAGAGAVATTVQDKLRESKSTADYNTLANAIAATPKLTWNTETPVTSSIVMASNQTLVTPFVTGDLSADYLINTGGTNQSVLSADIDGSVTTGIGSHGIGHTGGNSVDTSVSLSRIDADRYGVLLNYDGLAAGATPEGFLGLGNFVKSGFDAYELNGDLTVIKYNVIASNIIDAGVNQVSPTNAFGVGLSSTHYSSVVGNVIKASVSRALHIEDKQKGTTLAANSGLTSGDGVYVVQDPATDFECNGVIGVGNHLTHTAASATSAGISLNTAATRSPTRNVFVGNQMVGFNFGASVGPMTGSNTAKVGQQIIDNNVFDTSVVGIRAYTLQQVHGENTAVAPTTLFELGNRASVGKIHATAAPTNIITRTDANFPGAYCRGFDFPIAFSHTGASYQNLLMFPLGDRMAGKIVCRGDAGVNGGWWCSADILWDGTTLTITNILRHLSGSAVINATTPFVASAGNLYAYVTYPTPYSSTMYVDFSGVYYKI